MSSWIHFLDPPRPDLADEDDACRTMEPGPAIASSPMLGGLGRSRVSLRRGRD